jgi:hypothetical protein
MVPRTEVESASVATSAPETDASTNSATWAQSDWFLITIGFSAKNQLVLDTGLQGHTYVIIFT